MTSTGRDNQLQFVHFSEGKHFTQFRHRRHFFCELNVSYLDFSFFETYFKTVHFDIEIAI